MNNICTECGSTILTMCFKGTGICGDLCSKARDKRALATVKPAPKKRARRTRKVP